MKYYGIVGYVIPVETKPGVWVEQVTERTYCGDVNKRLIKTQGGIGLNDDMTLNNVISIIVDPYAIKNLGFIRYVTWMNSKWKVSSVDYVHPRLNITIGGVYNAEEQN